VRAACVRQAVRHFSHQQTIPAGMSHSTGNEPITSVGAWQNPIACVANSSSVKNALVGQTIRGDHVHQALSGSDERLKKIPF